MSYQRLRDAVRQLSRRPERWGHRPVIVRLEAGLSRPLRSLCEVHKLQLIDRIEPQLQALVRTAHPQGASLPAQQVDRLIEEHLDGHTRFSYGCWIYYPWRSTLVHLLPSEALWLVRSDRNREKITREEQRLLRSKVIGIVGLSVGHEAALVIAQEGLCGRLRLADFDHLTLSNLNRLRSSVCSLGLAKTTICAREIAELDPYLELELLEEGIHQDNVEAFLGDQQTALDLVVEECDSLPIKLLVRERARARRIPVIMDTNDRGLLDVERFDLEPERPLLHGLLGVDSAAEVDALDPQGRGELFARFFEGRQNMSPRFRDSLDKLGSTLTGFSQLASDTHLGAALVSHAARRLLLGQQIPSGRYRVDLQTLINPA